MAETSKHTREWQRRVVVQRYAARRAELKATIASTPADPAAKQAARGVTKSSW